VFPSSVDLEIEFEPFAFVDCLQSRTLNRADVHKRIRLTIVANQETKPLHGIEEFDCSGCFFSGQLALWWSCFALLNGNDVTDNLNVLSRHFAAAINQVKLKALTLS
jgi:hypothetical protein